MDLLTTYDLSTIKNEAQLRAMVEGRTSRAEAEATSDVQAWMEGKPF
jgi:hypothetical protein